MPALKGMATLDLLHLHHAPRAMFFFSLLELSLGTLKRCIPCGVANPFSCALRPAPCFKNSEAFQMKYFLNEIKLKLIRYTL